MAIASKDKLHKVCQPAAGGCTVATMPLFAQRFLTKDTEVQGPISTFDATRGLRVDSSGKAVIADLSAVGPMTTRGDVDHATSFNEIVTKAEVDNLSADRSKTLLGPIKTSAGADRSARARM